jgi:hypothetical protein
MEKIKQAMTKLTSKTFLFKLPSKSEKGKFHTISESKRGSLICDCTAGKFERECRHKRITSNTLKGLKYNPDEYK